jgi:hypothetical protein
MKFRKLLAIGLVMLLLIAGMAACGSSSAKETQMTEEQQAEVTTVPDPDPSSNVDSLVGEWTDISASDRFAKITKNGDAYQYEDNDGTYSATFSDGVLVIAVNERDTANAYIDKKTGHLILIFQDSKTEFAKK